MNFHVFMYHFGMKNKQATNEKVFFYDIIIIYRSKENEKKKNNRKEEECFSFSAHFPTFLLMK